MENKTDILIIGGSSIGLNCAYYLLKSGRKVTILEANEIAKGNASGNAGQIVPSHIIPLAAPGVASSALKWMLDEKTSPFGMAMRLDGEYIRWLIQFARSCTEANLKRGIPAMRNLGQLSAANFESLIKDEKIECHYGQAGMGGRSGKYKRDSHFAWFSHLSVSRPIYQLPITDH